MNNSEITVKVISSAAEIEALRPFLAKLNCHPESDLDFVAMLPSVRPEILRPHVVVAYQNGEPAAVLIGRLENASVQPRIGYFKLFKLPLKQLVFVRDGFLGECSDEMAGRMIKEVVKSLKGCGADRALFSNLLTSSAFIKSVKKHSPLLQRDYSRELNQHWKTRLPDDFNKFLAKRPKKHRYWLKRIPRVFEEEFEGKVKYTTFEGPQDVDAFCKAAEEVAKNTYQRGLGVGFMDNEENRKRLGLMAEKGWFRAYAVFLDGKPIAFWAGECANGVMYLASTGFDPAHRKYEAGTILFMKMLQDLIARGVKEIDYGLGWAQYKERFGDECLEEQSISICAASLKGYGTNMIRALESLTNRTGKRLVAWLKIRERIKKIWRSDLAGKAKSEVKPDAETPVAEVEAAVPAGKPAE